MSHKLITIAESRLQNELETYSNIPFFLGILYLSLTIDNELSIGDTAIKLGMHDEKCCLLTSAGAGWKETDITKLKYTRLDSDLYTYTIHPVLTLCHFYNPIGRDGDLPKDYSKKYIHYKNKSIKSILDVLVNNYMKEYKYIPFLYMVPYLYFNRNKTLHLDVCTAKYSLQNSTIVLRPKDSVRAYGRVMSPSNLSNMYQVGLDTPHKYINFPPVLVTI